ncbi:unnamed protein product [Trichogramma brassicae]|uniref:Uncharacterized protein n=1 Tax=Trichogramma brassicae TaxID=86971 RepID=A0A6H5I181_9HYME|nr:unnamed protein product [Trichogramma brassicae]
MFPTMFVFMSTKRDLSEKKILTKFCRFDSGKLARALPLGEYSARASTSDRSASSPGAFSTRRAADRRPRTRSGARPCIGH